MTSLLWTLAFDHRNSLRRSFFGITGAATEVDHQRAREAKGIIFDGVLAAIGQGIPIGQPAVLVDEEYGADVIARARALGIATAVPVEASGEAVVRFEHGDDGFGPALERLDPTYAKVLVRYNPDGDPDDNRVQRERLSLLQRWVSGHGRKWMLELLVPPTPAQTNQCGGDDDVYDANMRPDLTARASAELADHGLRPELWKLEGMATSEEYAAIAAACRVDGERSGCLVLGRGADEDAVDRWLSLAAPVPGFVGFAVGRTLWWKPLRDVMAGACTGVEAAERIGANYRRLIDVYLAAVPPRHDAALDVTQEDARMLHESRKQLHGHSRSPSDLTSAAEPETGDTMREQSPVIDEHGIAGVSAAFLREVTSRLDQLATGENLSTIEAAGELVARALQSDGIVHAFGTGHSEAFAMEIAGRAGGLIPTNRIALRDVVLDGKRPASALAGAGLERDASVVSDLLDGLPLHPADVFLIASNSGVNGSIVEMALQIKARGHGLIAVTSLEHTNAVEPKHPSGKRLSEIADVVIDNLAPYGDSTLRLDGLGGSSGIGVGAVSSMTAAFIAQIITIDAAQRLQQAGEVPPIYVSANVPGGDEHNQVLEDRYRGRIRRLA